MPQAKSAKERARLARPFVTISEYRYFAGFSSGVFAAPSGFGAAAGAGVSGFAAGACGAEAAPA
jgi:hypothetical protein